MNNIIKKLNKNKYVIIGILAIILFIVILFFTIKNKFISHSGDNSASNNILSISTEGKLDKEKKSDNSHDNTLDEVAEVSFNNTKKAEIKSTSVNLIVGQSAKLKVDLEKSNIESDNNDIAAIEENKIVAISKGETLVKVFTKQGEQTYQIFVYVEEPKYITVSANTKGEKIDLNEYIKDESEKPIYWESSDPRLADINIDTGEVTILNNGNATIIAEFEDGHTVDIDIIIDFPELPYDGRLYPEHEPIGTAIGVNPDRVVWEHNPLSTNWDDQNTFWWKTNHFDAGIMQQMVVDGIQQLAGEDDTATAWDKLFTYHNERHGRTGGYIPGQKIAIKMNMNGCGFYDDSVSGEVREDYTNPVFAQQFLISLVRDGGVRPQDITIYDCGRLFPTWFYAMCSEGILEGVQVRCRSLYGPNDAVPNQDAPVKWSKEFPGAPAWYPYVVTEATYIIDFASLKAHTYGITLSAKNHFGSFVCTDRARVPQAAGVHKYLEQQNMNDYSPLVDLLGSYQLGEKCFLYVYDAFICAPGESVEVTVDNSKWRQAPFNNYWTSSCFFSQDPIALDSVGADLLTNEPEVINRNNSTKTVRGSENYLHEASQANNPPSHTLYTNGAGEQLHSLGVHEHWNNSAEKQYSRNLGKDDGIELVYRGPDEQLSESLKAFVEKQPEGIEEIDTPEDEVSDNDAQDTDDDSTKKKRGDKDWVEPVW